ncbi:MAG: hypothetical protein GY841_21615 [FCB group bacterium]|nr:hypothetical protein [FCB group bacterium]
MDIKSYIDDLFEYLDKFENHYDEFKTEAFLQTYNGIYAVFQALGQQREQAIEVDRYFLERIKKTPITSSDLRQLTIQLLITFFESEADIDGQSNKAYLYCRDLRPIKRDVTYFESHLVPTLFREGSLNNNFPLNDFMLKEIARYLGKFGRGLQNDLSPESFAAMDDSMKFLELMRRRLILGTDLAADRNSLEFHLLRVDAFGKIGAKSVLFDRYLTEWGYLRKDSFWSKIKSSLGDFWGRIKGAFKSTRYFRLVTTQRPAAFLLYGLVIVFFILLAIYVPVKWSDYSQSQLENMQQKASEVQKGAGK